MDDEKESFYVDVPNPYAIEDSWVNVEIFATRDEAIAFAQKYFGADENGNVCLVSNP